ncbi:discoidin domain-containing protein [Nocardioides speluncae]|uniref:discoidin domain-containing protein n=1 Tax=Nocardioides speluncae TaxID=2670337 RepID=UPI000D688311|nr:discoidin domain-containing protein [Nocardioides speluncae]
MDRIRSLPATRKALATFVVGLALLGLVPTAPSAAISSSSSAVVVAGENLAAGRPMSAKSHHDVYAAANAADGQQATYWESANHAFPQWIQVDLGAGVPVERVVLKLPTAGWEARTQTIEVLGSTDGQQFGTLVPAADYGFAPAQDNTVSIGFDTVITRHVRVQITGNTAWPAAQVSELEVYGPSSGDTEAPTAPGSLSFTEPDTDRIRLAWEPAHDNVGVTGYDVYANGALLTSVAGDVRTHTDTRRASETVRYTVRARDAAGNESPASNEVTRVGDGSDPGGTDLAAGKPITASSTVHVFEAANANDGDATTYWEGASGAYPSTLTVQLGSEASVNSVEVALNPDPVWGARTQTFEILGRAQGATEFTTIRPSAGYRFDPADGNDVTIPVTATVAELRLRFTGNTGAPNGQVAELRVIGTPAPNPDLLVGEMSWTPSAPVETDPVSVSAVVHNVGSRPAAATTVDVLLDGEVVDSAPVAALAAGAQTAVSVDIGKRSAGSYRLGASVDPAADVAEEDEENNTFENPTPLVVEPVASADLVPSALAWSPDSPSAGEAVAFSVAIANQGSEPSSAAAHGITLTVNNDAGQVVATRSGSHSGVIGSGQTTAAVSLGSWTAADGRYAVTVEIAPDSAELPEKRENNSTTKSLFVGRGADMPYDTYQAEDGVVGGGAQVLGPNRTIGDLAGEASGRRAVTLNDTGSYVEFTTRAATNTLVTRFSIPDAPGGGGTTATLNIYVDGQLLKPITLTSRFAWLYGNEANPGNSPGQGPARHIYDEANVMLGRTVPAGSRIRLQKDAANTSRYAIDFIDLEEVAPRPNPDPAAYVVPDGFGHQDVQNALDEFRMDTTGRLKGVYLPAGDYQTSNKLQVYGKPVEVVGAGPWFTRFHAPQGQENTDVGFRAEAAANGSTFTGFAYFGNYTSRIDGPGKVFDFQNVANMTISDMWVEHMVCMYWGANTDNMTIKDSRTRNLFADVINMTNGSTGNRVANIESRASGDDAFALFSATDAGGGANTGNVYENLSALVTWRAAGVAVYGGENNTFRNLYIADTLVYSGITISSLDFGYPMAGFGPGTTRFENVSLVRAGGHFWGAQTFPAIWLFSASKQFRAIRLSDIDIVDPTYSGIMFQTQYIGGQPVNPVTDTELTDVSITGARRSGDEFDHKSGFGIWANELPEAGQGPAVGRAVFNDLRMSDNHQNIRNTTSTFEIVVNSS